MYFTYRLDDGLFNVSDNLLRRSDYLIPQAVSSLDQ